MVGLLAIGRTDGNLPIVTEKRIPIRNMMLQYNYVFDRARGVRATQQSVLAAVRQHARAAQGRRTRQGDLSPAARAGQLQAGKWAKVPTVWYAGPLDRASTCAAPSSSSRATCSASPRRTAGPTRTCPPIPQFPDHLRDIQFTVNGQFQPAISSKAGQTEIWVLANVSDIAYMRSSSLRRRPAVIPRSQSSDRTAIRFRSSLSAEGKRTRLLIPPAAVRYCRDDAGRR